VQILKRKANINAALLLIVMQVVSMQGSERFRGWFRNGVLNCSEVIQKDIIIDLAGGKKTMCPNVVN